MSFKDLEFKGRAKRQTADQTEMNTQAVAQLHQMVLGLSYTVFQLEQKLNSMQALVRVSEYRSLALQRLLTQESGSGVTEASITRAIMQLQVEDFDRSSAEDDTARGLTNADGEAATEGQVAIVTISFLDSSGVELMDERIVRSKITLGKGEIFNGALDSSIVGLKVGQVTRVEMKVGEEARTAEVALLGLRNVPAELEKASEESQG